MMNPFVGTRQKNTLATVTAMQTDAFFYPKGATTMNLLHIDSSPLNTASVSRQLTAAIVEQWKQIEPALKITHRDLAAQAPAHLSAEILQINFSKPEDWTPNQRSEAALSDLLMEEFLKSSSYRRAAVPMQTTRRWIARKPICAPYSASSASPMSRSSVPRD
jgi:hypothetical protein